MGRRAYYRPKSTMPESVTLTELGRRILRSAADRTCKSKSDVVENLLRTYGAAVQFDDKTEADAAEAQ